MRSPRPPKSRFARRFGRPPAPAGTALPPPASHPTGRTEGYLLLRRPIVAPSPGISLPEGVTLVPLDAADAPLVHRLLKAAYASGFGTVPESVLAWWKLVTTDSEFDRNLATVARAGDEVIGFCLCWTSGFVKDLAVDARWRQRGIASALLVNAIESLARRGCEEVALKVDIYNAPAQRLYRRFGFEP